MPRLVAVSPSTDLCERLQSIWDLGVRESQQLAATYRSLAPSWMDREASQDAMDAADCEDIALAAALRCSLVRVKNRVNDAHRAVHLLPQTFARLEEGVFPADWFTRALTATRSFTDEEFALLDVTLASWDMTISPEKYWRELKTVVTRILTRRNEPAHQGPEARRRAEIGPILGDGTGCLQIIGPLPEIMALGQDLDTQARAVQEAQKHAVKNDQAPPCDPEGTVARTGHHLSLAQIRYWLMLTAPARSLAAGGAVTGAFEAAGPSRAGSGVGGASQSIAGGGAGDAARIASCWPGADGHLASGKHASTGAWADAADGTDTVDPADPVNAGPVDPGATLTMTDGTDDDLLDDQQTEDLIDSDSVASGRSRVSRPRFRVNITVPLLSLMGLSDQPALVNGTEPIPADMARALAAGESTWYRVMTDPATGEFLPLPANPYRPSTAMREHIRLKSPQCAVPGCTRSSQTAIEVDHIIEYDHHHPDRGGQTEVENLHHLCWKHHDMKTRGLLDPVRTPGGTTTWSIRAAARIAAIDARDLMTPETITEMQDANRAYLRRMAPPGGPAPESRAP